MDALVANLRAALAARIEQLTWMSPETKKKAEEKLSQFTVKIGYPDKWRDYSALSISPDDLYGDAERHESYEWNRQVARLHKPVDKMEWDMTPQTVNAYYNPSNNEVVFPAAILQPPFFDPAADPAVNYGGIGVVIGHEPCATGGPRTTPRSSRPRPAASAPSTTSSNRCPGCM